LAVGVEICVHISSGDSLVAGHCWVVVIACAANGWHQPLTIGSHHFSMVRQPTMPNLAAMFDSRTSGVAPQMPIKEA